MRAKARVERVLSNGPSGKTELVRRIAAGADAGVESPLLVRKRIPLELANARAWEVVRDLSDPRIPQVENIYTLPDAFVVVVCSDGVHLIDLGIARVHESEATSDTRHLGTWGFAAPEQYGFAQTDVRSDIFAEGRLLAFAVTGLRPDDPGFPAALHNEAVVPKGLRAVIEKACALEPSARYRSDEELADALARYAGAFKRHPVVERLIVAAEVLASALMVMGGFVAAEKTTSFWWGVLYVLFATEISVFGIVGPVREIRQALFHKDRYA